MKKTSMKALIIGAAFFCALGINVANAKGEEITTEVPTTIVETTTVEEPTSVDVTTVEATTEKATTKNKTVIIPKKGYYITSKGKKVTCYYNGNIQKKICIAFKKVKGKYKAVKPTTKGAVIYSFNKKGIGKKYLKTGSIKIKYKKKATKLYVFKGKLANGWDKKKKHYYKNGKLAKGWTKIKKKYYFFKKNGKIAKNQIVYSGKTSYYVDQTGARVTSTDIKVAVNYVNKHSNKNDSRAKRLSDCYRYLCTHFSYQRFYDKPVASSMPGYVTYMLTHGSGNCFRYAASFAYMAKVLGYDSRVAVGMISSINGGMTPHGWTEVKVNGHWYMCDADMQAESHGVDSYMKTESTYKYRHYAISRHTIKIKNGKVSWK